ncbi:hypothetical protein KCU73_g4370, partial [Aureobasidium melanogenum]
MASPSAAPTSGDCTGSPTFQLTREQFEEHEVWKAYKGYLPETDPQDPNFENFYQLCLRFGYIPNLDAINWIIREANLIDFTRRLQFPVYAFLQEFKFDFHVDPKTHRPRMLVAHIYTEAGPCPIWAGWSSAGIRDSKARMKLYVQPHADENGTGDIQIAEGYRCAFHWEEPFETLFKLGKYTPTHANALTQNAILLSVAKVIVRFPGLVRPPPGRENSGPWLRMRAAFSSRPFDIREHPSPLSPWWDAYDIFNTGVVGFIGIHAHHPPDSEGMKRYLQKEAEKRLEQAEKKVEKARQKVEEARRKAEEARQKAEQARQEAKEARKESKEARQEARQKAVLGHTQIDIDSTNSVPTTPKLGNGHELSASLDTNTSLTAPQSTEMDIYWSGRWTSEHWRWLNAEDLQEKIWR